MDIVKPASLTDDMLDTMIRRAEAACERYRSAAAAPGLNPFAARARRHTLKQMEESLARLRVQRGPRQGA